MNRVYFVVGCLMLVSLLSACGTVEIRGTRPGSSQADFSNDLMECKAISARLYGYDESNTLKTCMQGKGWSITTKPTLF
jgi:hypothetical protein